MNGSRLRPSHMSAFILVFSHRYFAATDDEGRYRIDGLPAGDYDVVAWTDGAVRSVNLVGGETTELDFVVE